MPLYEVKVREIVERYYEVDAKNADEAERRFYSLGTEAGSVVEQIDVVSVTEAFEDDGAEYDIDFEDEEDYDG